MGRCHGIQGGAEQIQLNVIGERILGLPPEPRVDKDVAFKDIPPPKPTADSRRRRRYA